MTVLTLREVPPATGDRMMFIGDGFVAYIVAPQDGFDWSYRNLRNPDPPYGYHEMVGREFFAVDAHTVFAPNVLPMNGRIVEPQNLRQIMHLPFGITHCRSPAPEHAGDVTYLEKPGHAFGMTNGGCPALVLSGYNDDGKFILVTAHAALESILNGVIDSMAELATRLGCSKLSRLNLYGFFQIPTTELVYWSQDPKYGAKNIATLERIRTEFGPEAIVPHPKHGRECISIGTMVLLRGLRFCNVISVEDNVLPIAGDFAYTTNPVPGRGGIARNHVIVLRTHP